MWRHENVFRDFPPSKECSCRRQRRWCIAVAVKNESITFQLHSLSTYYNVYCTMSDLVVWLFLSIRGAKIKSRASCAVNWRHGAQFKEANGPFSVHEALNQIRWMNFYMRTQYWIGDVIRTNPINEYSDNPNKATFCTSCHFDGDPDLQWRSLCCCQRK